MIPNKKLLKTQIVVVEDDEILSATIHKYLSSKGFNVSCFNSDKPKLVGILCKNESLFFALSDVQFSDHGFWLNTDLYSFDASSRCFSENGII